MHAGNKFASIKRATDGLLAHVHQCIVRGDYSAAEKLAQEALNNWRTAGAPREEEGTLISTLGKCLEAQRKYEQAYELYMQALNYLTGETYREVYTNFLYLNERMGTFVDPSKLKPKELDNDSNTGSNNGSSQESNEPHYPPGYYDDFGS